MTPQYCRLPGLPHSHTEVTREDLDVKYLSPMPQKGFLWNTQILTDQSHVPPLLPCLTVWDLCSLRNGGPRTLLGSKRIKLFHLWNLWLGTLQNVLAYSVGYPWNTTSSSQYWSTLSPSAGKDSCFMSCYKTCQKPTQMQMRRTLHA